MSYREFAPSPALRPWVRCFWTLSDDASAAGPTVQRVLPDGCADVIVDLGDRPIRVGNPPGQGTSRGPRERVYAVGTMTRPLLVERSGKLDYVGVRFRPGRAAAFLGIALGEITDARVGLEHLWGPAAARCGDRIAESGGTRARLSTMEAVLLARLRGPGGIAPDPRVDRVVAGLLASAGRAAIGGLADGLGVSRQHLTRSFRRQVGVPPKLFARVVRLQAALEQARSRPAPQWSRIAHEAGYCDQSHLIRDCRELAGEPPTAIVRAR